MVFLSTGQWNIKAMKLSVFIIFSALFIGEYLVFLTTSLIWNVPVKRSEDDLKVLFLSDPQIQGFQFESWGFVGYITRWDAYHYLKKTFSFAMNAFQPDVIIILGDLFDEGYIASDEAFLLYKEWLEDIYKAPGSVKRIFLAGDNDVGGEAEELSSDRLRRHEKYFGRTNDMIQFKNWQFVKLNTLSFLRFYQFTTWNEKRILDNLEKFTSKTITLLDSKKHTVILSHLPVSLWDATFAAKVLRKVNPRVIFSGHLHKASHKSYKLSSFSTEEYIVPTCSYRMGTVNMGMGAAVFEKDGSFQYSVLKLPARYSFLYLYLVIFSLSLLYIFVCGRIKRAGATFLGRWAF